MRVLKLKAYAKINLYLDVLGRREDGYHAIQTIMQSISLCDELRITSKSSGIEVLCSSPDLSNDQDNLVFKSASLLREYTGIKHGACIELGKNIPIGAGLAGGSADAAATLIGLNDFWSLNLPVDELMRLAARLGSDIPFCILGGAYLAEGRGEKLTKLNSFPRSEIVIAKPDLSLSTAEIYNKWDAIKTKRHPEISGVLKSLKQGNLVGICSGLANTLEDVVMEEHPEVRILKKELLQAGALGVLMSGSGPSVFAIIGTKEQAATICRILQGKYFAVTATPYMKGVEIVQD